MSDESSNSQPEETKCRPVGGTEYSWCKAVPGGTGTTVLALLLSKPPNFLLLDDALHKIQNSKPILRSKLHFDVTTNAFSFITPSTPHLQIESFDLTSTPQIIESLSDPNNSALSPFHLILEHELNRNAWLNPDPALNSDTDVLFASVYILSDDRWVVIIRLHTAACDRAAAVSLLRELLDLVRGGREREISKEVEVGLALEDYIPSGKTNKPFWARGVDMLGYSLNSFMLANLNFKDIQLPRSSEFVRLKISSDDTDRILSGCKSRGIKLCGLLAAAGLIAARSSKNLPNETWEKYAIATLIDCRSSLDPVLSCHHVGFYHSVIINSHDIKGGEELWELARRTYTSFSNAKNSNKHFTDMADLNFLMCKAIDNPALTPSTSLRTALISVFEDLVIDHSNEFHGEIGLEDYVGCASVHGVSPSLAIFDTIRDGELDCACVYASPLHSREQMQDIVSNMKKILVDGCK